MLIATRIQNMFCHLFSTSGIIDKCPKSIIIYYVKYLRGVAQLGRALGSGLRGRRFKSCHPDI